MSEVQAGIPILAVRGLRECHRHGLSARLHFKMAAGVGTIPAGFAGEQNIRVLGQKCLSNGSIKSL